MLQIARVKLNQRIVRWQKRLWISCAIELSIKLYVKFVPFYLPGKIFDCVVLLFVYAYFKSLILVMFVVLFFCLSSLIGILISFIFQMQTIA